MTKYFKFFIPAFLLFVTGIYVPVYAEKINNASRGELLYAKNCNVCHTSKVHWRDQKQVKNWDGILVQVRRWQSTLGLNWSEEKILDVANYLNENFYKFKYSANQQSMSLR
jgi:hypothetical protein